MNSNCFRSPQEVTLIVGELVFKKWSKISTILVLGLIFELLPRSLSWIGQHPRFWPSLDAYQCSPTFSGTRPYNTRNLMSLIIRIKTKNWKSWTANSESRWLTSKESDFLTEYRQFIRGLSPVQFLGPVCGESLLDIIPTSNFCPTATEMRK